MSLPPRPVTCAASSAPPRPHPDYSAHPTPIPTWPLSARTGGSRVRGTPESRATNIGARHGQGGETTRSRGRTRGPKARCDSRVGPAMLRPSCAQRYPVPHCGRRLATIRCSPGSWRAAAAHGKCYWFRRSCRPTWRRSGCSSSRMAPAHPVSHLTGNPDHVDPEYRETPAGVQRPRCATRSLRGPKQRDFPHGVHGGRSMGGLRPRARRPPVDDGELLSGSSTLPACIVWFWPAGSGPWARRGHCSVRPGSERDHTAGRSLRGQDL